MHSNQVPANATKNLVRMMVAEYSNAN